MQRIYIEHQEIGGETFILDEKDIYNQIIKVLRGTTGDEFIFFDGETFFDFKYKITSLDKKNIFFQLQEKIPKTQEKIEINLFQALPNKIDKIEDIIEKGTQIGYTRFIFFKSKRAQEIFLSENKLQRFQKIIQESVELSGRNMIPEIIFTKKIDLQSLTGEKFYFHTQNSDSHLLKNIDFSYNKYNLFVGPEGGFDDSEIQDFEKNNFKKIYLGENILRTQTAGIVVGFYISQQKI